MKQKAAIICLLLLIMVLLTAAPTFAGNSKHINGSSYGINKDLKSSTIKITQKKKTYTISPKTKPCDKAILNLPSYNKHTKHYYTLSSYMNKFEKAGGGTLILKKGTYVICSSVAIPSNVNLVMRNGVIIKKGKKTGTKKLSYSTAIFQLVAPSKLKKNGVYAKYNGVKNVKIIGKGKSVINLRYVKNSLAIVCGHNKNIQIRGITFKNLNGSHFIELDATYNMKISKCCFINSKPSPKLNKEAINLDTPDKNTNGFHNPWSTYDKTPNKKIIIENNLFAHLDRAIGTHKYSQKKINGKYITKRGQIYHKYIIIHNNRIIHMRSDAIRALNWKNSKIINNYIAHISKKSKKYRAVLASGVINLKIKHNYFKNMSRPIQVFPTKNPNNGSIYSVTYNKLSPTNYNDMEYNLCEGLNESFARISMVYNAFANAMKIYLKMT
ncbi:hypothetical protein [Methanobacterium alcaliphilum]|uniref:hypothetical protein n=1 Tax=Methanobacterium alcaliphilum TaxID=392018 RepID=UPI00200ACCA7|nr:hypothetical protein [Methanobacterium alcaliphilum]MCK9151555.1 hypothetical protein [Methanobacterium alcaliphilum]